jgi:hypothetical protein
MVWKDHKSQAIFFENQEKVEKNSSAQPGFWEIKKQYSKDAVLNELCRQDAELEQPGIKHVFRHGAFLIHFSSSLMLTDDLSHISITPSVNSTNYSKYVTHSAASEVTIVSTSLRL